MNDLLTLSNGFYLLGFICLIVAIYIIFFYKPKPKEKDDIVDSIIEEMIDPHNFIPDENIVVSNDIIHEVTKLEPTFKQKANIWWKGLSTGDKKIAMFDGQIPERTIASLTRAEIQDLYRLHLELHTITTK